MVVHVGVGDPRVLRTYGSTALRGCLVSHLAVSDALQRVVVSDGGRLLVHDLRTGAWDGFHYAVDGEFILAASLPGGNRYVLVTTLDVELRDFATDEVLASWQLVDAEAAALSGCGEHLAVASREALTVFSIPTGNAIARRDVDARNGLALSPMGDVASFGDGMHTLCWVDVHSGTHRGEAHFDEEILGAPSFTAGGKRILVPTTYGLVVVDASTGARSATFKHTPDDLPDRVVEVCPSPEGDVIATVHERSGVLVLWDPSTGSERAAIDLHGHDSARLCFTGAGRLWVGVAHSVTAIDVTRGVELPVSPGLRTSASVLRAAGDCVLAWGDPSAITLFDARTAIPLRVHAMDARIDACDLDARGERFAMAADLDRLGEWRDRVEWFDVRTGGKLGEATDLRAKAIAFAGPDVLFTGDYDGTLRRHVLDGEGRTEVVATLDDMIEEIAVARDGATLAVRTYGGRVAAWTPGSAHPEPVPLDDREPTALAWPARDPTQLWIGCSDGSVHAWDGASVAAVDRLDDGINRLAADATGLVAAASGSAVLVFDAAARRRVATVELALLPEDGPLALAFSTTASELVVSTMGGAVVALALADLLEP